MPTNDKYNDAEVLSAGMGQWVVAAAPRRIRSLLGSCVGVVLYDAKAKLGGVAHVVLPDSRGETANPGKYVDTAIPGMLSDLRRMSGGIAAAGRITAKLVGGAAMFQGENPINIGGMNQAAAERVLARLGIPVLARDLGGDAGRKLVFDTLSGIVTIRIPGGEDYTI